MIWTQGARVRKKSGLWNGGFLRFVAAEAEGGSALGGDGLDAFEECLRGAGECCVAAVNEKKLAVDAQLGDLDLHKLTARELVADGEAGGEGDSVAHGDE